MKIKSIAAMCFFILLSAVNIKADTPDTYTKTYYLAVSPVDSPEITITSTSSTATINGASFTKSNPYKVVIPNPLTENPTINITELASTSPDGFVTTLFTINGTGSNKGVVNSFHINLDLSNQCSWDWKPFYQPNDTKNYLPTQVNYSCTTIPGFGQPVPSNTKPTLYGPLNTDKVYLVDYNAATGNMFFRGNIPTTPGMKDQSVDFQTLCTTFNTRLEEEGIDVQLSTDSYNLIIVPLINSIGEGLSVESKSFNVDNPPPNHNLTEPISPNDPGFKNAQLLWWEIWADPTKTATIENLATTLVNLMNNTEVTNLSNVPKTGKKIIYIHCANGDDRTGICATTYLKQMYGSAITPDQAYVYGTTVSQWNPPGKYSGGAQYCRDLVNTENQAVKNKSRIYPSNPGPSTYLTVIESIIGSVDNNCYTNNASGQGIGYNSFPWQLTKAKADNPTPEHQAKEGDL